MLLSDGRHILREDRLPRGPLPSHVIPIHKEFRMIVLANRPGFPFKGNNFFRECGDCFSTYVIIIIVIIIMLILLLLLLLLLLLFLFLFLLSSFVFIIIIFINFVRHVIENPDKDSFFQMLEKYGPKYTLSF